jgi:hypothetical protein
VGPVGPEGPQGPVGPQGAPGPKGDQGEPGLSCWDTNGNGICDLEEEDINGDGVCDTKDCQGAGGSSDIIARDALCELYITLGQTPPAYLECGRLLNIVFVTSMAFDGDLVGELNGSSGVESADAFCQQAARTVGLRNSETDGAYRAWISGPDGEEGTSQPADWPDNGTHDLPYKLLNGRTIADNFGDLLDGDLHHPINVTEYRKIVPFSDPGFGSTPVKENPDAFVWTYTNIDGTENDQDPLPKNNCDGWTSSEGSKDGAVGCLTESGEKWTVCVYFYSCAYEARLYCVEQ